MQNGEGGNLAESFRRICVFGAGAIGSALAAKLAVTPALSGSTISVVGRGAHLEAIRTKGIHLFEQNKAEPLVAHVRATASAGDLDPQDLVIVTLKGHQLSSASADIAGLIKPGGRVLMIQNGIPWWYFHADRTSGLEGHRIDALDPGGLIWRHIDPGRVIGGVIYLGARVSEPGHVHLSGSSLLHLGEPSGELTSSLSQVAALVDAAGWTARPTDRIRDEIWLKLQGNAAFNPISALTRATMADIIDGPLIDLTRDIMEEVRAVAERLGCRISLTIEERLNHSRGLGAARTSMLQDVEQGRPMEITPLTHAVTLLGQMGGVPTPSNDVLLSLVSQLDRSIALIRTEG